MGRGWVGGEPPASGIPVRLPDVKAKKSKQKLKSTAALRASDKPADKAELAWRTAVPVIACVLMLLAVPLSKLRPRHGR